MTSDTKDGGHNEASDTQEDTIRPVTHRTRDNEASDAQEQT